MTYTRICLPTLFLLPVFAVFVSAQTLVEGYVFEKNNRGYISQVNLSVYAEGDSTAAVKNITGDIDGRFTAELKPGRYTLLATKEPFEAKRIGFEVGEQKVFLKVDMQRKPGYLFDASLAEARENPDQIVDAVSGARIEVYNRTRDTLELNLNHHPDAFFKHYLEPGNHYTILIRKEGYLAKRIEVYVNIKGCILCVNGVRNVTPGVTDNLTAGNSMGTLIANIEMVSARLDKSIVLQNIHYDHNGWALRPEATSSLDNIVTLFQDNPGLSAELGSHTDSRGAEASNLALSQTRAEVAMVYVVSKGVDFQRVTAKGYGEAQIANRCVDGAECSDSEHAENRRTVLRITGLPGLAMDSMPSLEKIVKDEQIALEARARTGNAAIGVGEVATMIAAMPADFSGIAIELARHTQELAPDHFALQGHRQIYWRVEKDKKYYYYAPFPGGRTAALQFLNKVVKPENPDARLVSIEKTGKKYL
jgi:outer membrane protein OmpA-like peptidoglycan-associated protein